MEFTELLRGPPSSEETPKNAPFTHDVIPFFEAFNYNVQNRPRNLFQRMLCQLQNYRTLCATSDNLRIDVSQGLNFGDTTKLLKGRIRRLRPRGTTGARDAAFRFIYILLKWELSSQFSSSSSSSCRSTSWGTCHRRKGSSAGRGDLNGGIGAEGES